MQPNRTQVEKSLAALSTEADGTTASVECFSQSATHDQELVADAIGSLPAGLLEQLESTIDVRMDRLDRARARLEQGDNLTAHELADRIVGRLVCDRLR